MLYFEVMEEERATMDFEQIMQEVSEMSRARASAIILKDDRVVLIQRKHGFNRDLYYLYPGGGVKQHETLRQAAVREAKEETGLSVSVVRLVAEVIYKGNVQYYFLTEVTGGHFGQASGPEIQGDRPFQPIWMDVDDLPENPVYPEHLSRIIADSVKSGWPQEIVKFEDEGCCPCQ